MNIHYNKKAIGIGMAITDRPSRTTKHTDRLPEVHGKWATITERKSGTDPDWLADGRNSHIRNLTITAYREEKEKRTLHTTSAEQQYSACTSGYGIQV